MKRTKSPVYSKRQNGLLRKIISSIAVAFLLAVSYPLFAAEKKVLILAGNGGTEEYRTKFYSQASQLRDLMMTKFGFAEQDITVLVETEADSLLEFSANDAKSVRSAFEQFNSNLTEDDALLVFIFGHGSFDGEWAKLNLTGPDLRDMDFANFLNKLPPKHQLLVNMASASGPFVEKVSKDGRIVVTATRNGIERNATRFADHFLRALEMDLDADLNKDGELSVTEAFIFARDNLIRDYEEKKQLRPEHPLLDDNGDGEGTETPDLLSGDGRLAANFLFRQQQQVPPRTSAANTEALSSAQKSILEQIDALKAQKDSMSEEAYYKALETLMIELAKQREN